MRNRIPGGTQRPVRFGFIGAGAVARAFAEGLQAVPGGVVQAVSSRTSASAASFVAEYPGVAVAESNVDLVRRPDIDIVYVATPHHRHLADSLLAIDHGKHVLCEKPLATSAADARRLAAAAREQGLFCMEAMWMRCIPAIRRARQVVESGLLGDPRLLLADFGVSSIFDPTSRLFDPTQGGGSLLDRGVYAISLAHMLFGRPEEVAGLTTAASTGVDEHAGVVLRFAEGRMAVIASSLTSTSENAAFVSGTGGQLRIEPPFYCPTRLSRWRTALDAAPATDATKGLRSRAVRTASRSRIGSDVLRFARNLRNRPMVERWPLGGNGYNHEAAEVVRCLSAGLAESPLVPLDASIDVLEIIDRVLGAGH